MDNAKEKLQGVFQYFSFLLPLLGLLPSSQPESPHGVTDKSALATIKANNLRIVGKRQIGEVTIYETVQK